MKYMSPVTFFCSCSDKDINNGGGCCSFVQPCVMHQWNNYNDTSGGEYLFTS